MIVTDWLLRHAANLPERTAFISDHGSIDYRETCTLVEGIARGLAARGRDCGAAAAVLSPNDPRAFASMLGILRAGGAWVPLNTRNTAHANADFIRRTSCRVLFWHSSLEADVDAIREIVGPACSYVRIDGDVSAADSLRALIADGLYVDKLGAADPTRVCTIVGTGGTTGTPKAVTWTEATWNALLDTALTHMPCDVPPVHLCAAPMTHAAGALAMMLMPSAPTNVVLRRPDPLEIMRAIQTHRVTHVYLPPTVLYLMLAHPDVKDFDYSSLRYFVVTAAPIAPERLREAVRVFGPVMAQCYGQSEAPMICTFFAPAEIAAAATSDDPRIASCGRVTVNTTLAIMTPEGQIRTDGDLGEIVVRGDLVMRGYLDDPAATAHSARHGWHHTGDVGRIDADGFVYVVDRATDMIITGGFNVYPAEVERVILAHPAVQDCAVIGAPHELWGEAVTAIVELKRDAPMSATTEELLRLCRVELGGVKTPKRIEVRESLPRSGAGKVLRRQLRDEFWAGCARAI